MDLWEETGTLMDISICAINANQTKRKKCKLEDEETVKPHPASVSLMMKLSHDNGYTLSSFI